MGLGTARALNIKYPDLKIILLEKEDELGNFSIFLFVICLLLCTACCLGSDRNVNYHLLSIGYLIDYNFYK